MIVTRRLELMPVTVEVLDAMAAGDGAAADAALGVRFPDPFRLPPETAEVLEAFRVQVAEPTDFPPYFVVRAMDRAVLGSAGTSAPAEDGVVVLGYGIYPEHERQGYASDTARALATPGSPICGCGWSRRRSRRATSPRSGSQPGPGWLRPVGSSSTRGETCGSGPGRDPARRELPPDPRPSGRGSVSGAGPSTRSGRPEPGST